MRKPVAKSAHDVVRDVLTTFDWMGHGLDRFAADEGWADELATAILEALIAEKGRPVPHGHEVRFVKAGEPE